MDFAQLVGPTTGDPNAVLVINNHEIKMLSFTCVLVSFFWSVWKRFLNQSEGRLRCEFQMLTGLSQRKYDAPILRLKFPILITQVNNTINY